MESFCAPFGRRVGLGWADRIIACFGARTSARKTSARADNSQTDECQTRQLPDQTTTRPDKCQQDNCQARQVPGGQVPGRGTCPTGTCQGVTCLLSVYASAQCTCINLIHPFPEEMHKIALFNFWAPSFDDGQALTCANILH